MRITAKQLRQIIKEELTRSMNEERPSAGFIPGVATDDEELPAVSMPSPRADAMQGIMSRVNKGTLERIENELLYGPGDAPSEAMDVLRKPTVRNELSKIDQGLSIARKGMRNPAIYILRELVKNALATFIQELEKELAKFPDLDHKHAHMANLDNLIIAMKSNDDLEMPDIRFACISAINELDRGDRGAPLEMMFDDSMEKGVMIAQYMDMIKVDGIIGKDTMDQLRTPAIRLTRLGL